MDNVCKFKLHMNLEINYGYTNASMMERYFKRMSEYCGRENMEHIVCETVSMHLLQEQPQPHKIYIRFR